MRFSVEKKRREDRLRGNGFLPCRTSRTHNVRGFLRDRGHLGNQVSVEWEYKVSVKGVPYVPARDDHEASTIDLRRISSNRTDVDHTIAELHERATMME